MGVQRREEGGTHITHLALHFKLELTSAKIQPGNIEVSSVASRVSNGEIWVTKGALNYE